MTRVKGEALCFRDMASAKGVAGGGLVGVARRGHSHIARAVAPAAFMREANLVERQVQAKSDRRRATLMSCQTVLKTGSCT